MTWLVRPSSSKTLDPRTLRRDRDLHVASQQELPRYLLQSWLPAQFRSGALAEKGDMADKFRALLVTKDGNRQSVAVTELTDADLMEGDVTVAVEHSTVNYKDGLAITGRRRSSASFHSSQASIWPARCFARKTRASKRGIASCGWILSFGNPGVSRSRRCQP